MGRVLLDGGCTPSGHASACTGAMAGGRIRVLQAVRDCTAVVGRSFGGGSHEADGITMTQTTHRM
eukprot:12316982-Alexandrium_andersonii.AAC.1